MAPLKAVLAGLLAAGAVQGSQHKHGVSHGLADGQTGFAARRGYHSGHKGMTHKHGFEEPHNHANAPPPTEMEVMETAEMAPMPEDAEPDCHMACDMIEDPTENSMCHDDCHVVPEEEENVMECLYMNCSEEFGACMGDDECMTIAMDEQKRIDCVMNGFDGCAQPLFPTAFACYMDKCFQEEHIPHIHGDADATKEDVAKVVDDHHAANQAGMRHGHRGFAAAHNHAEPADYQPEDVPHHHHHPEGEKVDEVTAAVATAEMDEEDPEMACHEACESIEDDYEREICHGDCAGVEEDAEEEDVWGCLMNNCEMPINNCFGNPDCANVAMDETRRMDCVTGKFEGEGCGPEFQCAFACYMDFCFHPTHVPHVHHEDVSAEHLSEIAHFDVKCDAAAEMPETGFEEEHYPAEYDYGYEENFDEGSYDEGKKQESYESYEEEYHHEEHKPEECIVFEGGPDARCDPKVWYCNGDCWMDCPEGFEHHNDRCVQATCPPGQHMTMNWDTDTPYCVDAEPTGILEKEYAPGHFRFEDWGDEAQYGCTEISAGEQCNPSEPKWYCNGWCEAEECWERGDGWHNLWLPIEGDEHGHWEVFCVKYEECGADQAQLHSWRGQQLCSGNWHEEQCDGTWSHTFSAARGHHVRVCVKGQQGEYKQPETTFERWEDEREDPTMQCINEFCPVVWSCAEDPECGQYLNEEDAMACLTKDCSAYPGIFKDSVECYFEHCHEVEEEQHHEEAKDGEDDAWTCLKENCPADVESCFADPLCGEVIMDDHKRDSCINAGFPIEECSEFLAPVFECYMSSCQK